jgi:hypothetical protein
VSRDSGSVQSPRKVSLAAGLNNFPAAALSRGWAGFTRRFGGSPPTSVASFGGRISLLGSRPFQSVPTAPHRVASRLRARGSRTPVLDRHGFANRVSTRPNSLSVCGEARQRSRVATGVRSDPRPAFATRSRRGGDPRRRTGSASAASGVRPQATVPRLRVHGGYGPRREAVGRVRKEAHRPSRIGTITGAAADALDAIIRPVRAGRWESVAEALYYFMKAQRCEGAVTRVHKTKKPLNGKAK